MPIERHLILQELTLRPSGEWAVPGRGWTVARVAEGSGYWLQGGNASELNVGGGLVVGGHAKGVLRASQLGPVKLQYFSVQPQYLNGLLTVAEWHQLEAAGNSPSPVSHFGAGEPVGQKFTRLAESSHPDGLSARCALLQLWVGAVAGLLAPPSTEPAGGNKLQERFHRLVGQLSEAELSQHSLADLAAQLHCSERHFSRLFRAEFGVSFHARQIELRLQRARQLLADGNAKIINVAYDSGYRHLGLFNAMFKKRFGVTPSEWRESRSGPARKPVAVRPRNSISQVTLRAGMLLALLALNFFAPVFGQTNPPPAVSPIQDVLRSVVGLKMAQMTGETNQDGRPLPVPTNAVPAAPRPTPHFNVAKYLVAGNSVLSPGTIGGVITNSAGAFGTNVTFDDIRGVLGNLQLAYRERGFVTVSVGLPQQKLTNAEVKLKVTEGRLAAINVVGNNWFSTENVLRALPGLHTNMLLNSHTFQRELDLANVSRNRQIYPVIGPGPEPDTSALTLKVKDRLPWHARAEVNNQSTPGTPSMRANFSSQYDNLWDLEHQVGIQYSFSFEQFKAGSDYVITPFDAPLVANYSAYYRMPLGRVVSVQAQIDANPSRFGYDEITHKFNLPPSTGRPELTFYTSRATTDTDVQHGPRGFATPPASFTNNGVVYTPLSYATNSAGQNITLNESLGLKFSMPLPQLGKVGTTLTVGADFKRYRQTSFNTNENFFVIQYADQQGQVQQISSAVPQAQTPRYSSLDYLPLNVGLNGSVPDQLGTTFFNAQANFNLFTFLASDNDFANVSYSPKARASYVNLQMGASREQKVYGDWSVLFRASGQWADSPLFGNEQFTMGGVNGVRGYAEGEVSGDSGWRTTIEPRAPLFNIGMVDGDQPFWIHGSVFMDYGETYLNDATAGGKGRQQFWGAGCGLTASIGTHLDARLTVAWPLLATAQTPVGDFHVYFGVGAQF